MPRLDARWLNFWNRGQAWYRFWQDAATEQGGGINGALSVTLESLSLAASGNVAVAGALSKSLDSIAIAAIGKIAVTGTAAKTLADIDKTLAGAVAIAGGIDAALAPLQIQAAGVAQVGGILAAELDHIAAEAAGQVAVAGALDAGLDGISLSATGVVGSVPVVGELKVTLAALLLAASGALLSPLPERQLKRPSWIATSGRAYIQWLLRQPVQGRTSEEEERLRREQLAVAFKRAAEEAAIEMDDEEILCLL